MLLSRGDPFVFRQPSKAISLGFLIASAILLVIVALTHDPQESATEVLRRPKRVAPPCGGLSRRVALCGAASGQPWPAKAIHLVVSLLRKAGPVEVSRPVWSHPGCRSPRPAVVVRTRPAPAATSARTSVAKSAPDGYISWSWAPSATHGHQTRRSTASCPTTDAGRFSGTCALLVQVECARRQ